MNKKRLMLLAYLSVAFLAGMAIMRLYSNIEHRRGLSKDARRDVLGFVHWIRSDLWPEVHGVATTSTMDELATRSIELGSMAGEDRESPEYAFFLSNWGEIKATRGRTSKAISLYREAEEIFFRYPDKSLPEIQSNIRWIQMRLGDALSKVGLLTQAYDAFTSAASAGSMYDPEAGTSFDTSLALHGRAQVSLLMGETEAARQDCDAAIDLIREELAKFPTDFNRRTELAGIHITLGSLAHAGNDTTGALEQFRRAEVILDEMLASQPDRYVRDSYADLHLRVADIYDQPEDAGKALLRYDYAREHLRIILNWDPADAYALLNLAAAETGLGWTELELGKDNDAESFFQAALYHAERLREIEPSNISFVSAEAGVLTEMGLLRARNSESSEANRLWSEAIALLDSVASPDIYSLNQRAIAYWLLGKREAALQIAEKLVEKGLFYESIDAFREEIEKMLMGGDKALSKSSSLQGRSA